MIFGYGKNNINNKIMNVRVDVLVIIIKFYYKYNVFICVILIYVFYNIWGIFFINKYIKIRKRDLDILIKIFYMFDILFL